MAGIRGVRNPFPTKPKVVSGIFKAGSTGAKPHASLLKSALKVDGKVGKTGPTNATNGLRHQTPQKQW